jgi:ABC-type transport system substrate-binding protein
MPNTMGYDKGYKSDGHDPARARALLDLYGYIDRDGDGWREQPDGSPLVLEISTQPDQASRRLNELQRKDYSAIGIRTEFKQAKWPENLKKARSGNYMVWSVGQSAAAPDGQPSFDMGATIHKGGQNLARFSNKEFDRLYERMQVIPDGAERERLFFEGKRVLAAYAPYRTGVHRIYTDLAWPWLIGYRRPPYWLAWWAYVDIDAEQQAKAVK